MLGGGGGGLGEFGVEGGGGIINQWILLCGAARGVMFSMSAFLACHQC